MSVVSASDVSLTTALSSTAEAQAPVLAVQGLGQPVRVEMHEPESTNDYMGGINLHRLRTIRALGAVAVAGAATLGAFSIVGPASAAVLKIKCTHLTGNLNGTLTLSGCNGNTGGASMPLPAFQFLGGGGTITWVNGKLTSVSMAATGENETDPAGGSCPAGTSELQSKGTVTADNTGSAPVGGIAKGEVCSDNSNTNLTLEPLSAFKFK